MSFFARREVETSLPCPKCGKNLHIARSCHEAAMRCPHCKVDFPLKDYVGRADKAMEEFLENCYMDRL